MPRVTRLLATAAFTFLVVSGAGTRSHAQTQRPLGDADIADIARLVMLEDTRRFDEAELARILKSTHLEVRRRAVITAGRIITPAGRVLLASIRGEQNPDILATIVFATGQLKDPDAVAWLDGLLTAETTSPDVAREAASSLGKIRTVAARAALTRYLANAVATPATAPIIGEALQSWGRFTTVGADIAPIVRWTTSPDTGIRWRATWALYRPKEPAAVPHLLALSSDADPEVRFWAVRGLTPTLVDTAGLDRARTSARLRDAVTNDADRRVRTEALRVLVLYDDDASFAVVAGALESTDTWLSVSAAEAVGRFKTRAEVLVPKLVAASAPGRPTSVRLSALAALQLLSPTAAIDLASSLVRDPSLAARAAAVQALGRLDVAGRARLDELSVDPQVKAMIPVAGAGRGARPAPPTRTEADYRQLVERLVVPDYSGAAKPRAILGTPRGEIEVELYAGDAPLGVEYFQKVVESGAIVGTEFGRLVPNFVAQQRAIRDDVVLRDEVNRRGLLRGTLSWASAGLDTGRPGYTLGSTPQPHNEGDFTALGRVIRGLAVVDRLELSDRITSARMVR